MTDQPNAALTATMTAAGTLALREALRDRDWATARDLSDLIVASVIAGGLRALIEHERPAGHGDALGVFGWLDGVAAALEARGGS